MIYTYKKGVKEKPPEEPKVEEEPKKDPMMTSEEAGKAAASLFLTPLVLMFVWNWSIPAIFGLQTINYLQAFCLIVIGRCFKND
tara:strand:- start:43 stop:294 length:252 start_codon:yes stop_codon:yes gene_type:complete